MATYRQVYISFWQDSYILDLDPEGKLLFIYLLTNTKTTQCGIYELPMKVMQFETGLDKNTIEQYLQKFEADGKILYSKETSEVFMVNWLKYNNIDSPKVKACIRKELMQVKNKSLLIAFLKTAKQLGYSTEELEDLADTVSIEYKHSEDTLSIEEENLSDTLSIGYGYPICNSQIPYGEEKEKEKEKEEEVEEEKEKERLPEQLNDDDNDDLNNPFRYYQQNIGPLLPDIVDLIEQYRKDLPDELITEAFRMAVRNNARNMRYAEKIMLSWIDKGIKTLDDLKRHEAEWESKKAVNAGTPEKIPKKSVKYKKFDFSV